MAPTIRIAFFGDSNISHLGDSCKFDFKVSAAYCFEIWDCTRIQSELGGLR